MIRVFVCPDCGKTRMVSKLLNADCHGCGTAMRLCDIPYSRWIELDRKERERLAEEWLRSEKDKSK